MRSATASSRPWIARCRLLRFPDRPQKISAGRCGDQSRPALVSFRVHSKSNRWTGESRAPQIPHPKCPRTRLHKRGPSSGRCQAPSRPTEKKGFAMQRIKPMSSEGNDQLAATYKRITETRGYVSAILESLSHAPAGLDAFA